MGIQTGSDPTGVWGVSGNLRGRKSLLKLKKVENSGSILRFAPPKMVALPYAGWGWGEIELDA